MASVEVLKTDIPGLEKFEGKVRDVYNLNKDNELLVIATDRISVFDVKVRNGIPYKGRVLTQLSAFWFDMTRDICPNHLITTDTQEIMAKLKSYGIANTPALEQIIDGRSMIVKKATPIMAECVVRGYLAGSFWRRYQEKCRNNPSEHLIVIDGIILPQGMKESERFPKPLFNPSTKGKPGYHDENMTYPQLSELCGAFTASKILRKSLDLYTKAAEYAHSRGIFIADTKMEFGMIDGELTVIDELLTPDSSRFWDAKSYYPGQTVGNLDKEFVRDWFRRQGFTGEGIPPDMTTNVICKTTEIYLEACRRLTGIT